MALIARGSSKCFIFRNPKTHATLSSSNPPGATVTPSDTDRAPNQWLLQTAELQFKWERRKGLNSLYGVFYAFMAIGTRDLYWISAGLLAVNT